MCKGRMEEAPENGKESPHSAHATGMNERKLIFCTTVHHQIKEVFLNTRQNL